MLGWLGGRKRKEARARARELGGDLESAVLAYLEAELPDEAARVLLLRADAEADPERRMALCAQAVRVGNGGASAREAQRRKAILGHDLLALRGAAAPPGELERVARELEAAGELIKAADAYRRLGDEEGEVRALEQAGAIERLESRLDAASDRGRSERDRAALLRKMADHDAVAERAAALAAARSWLGRSGAAPGEAPLDEPIALAAERIRGRLLRPPRIALALDGKRTRFVLGSSVTIGRCDADLVVPIGAVSRQHLRLFRRDGAAWVEDLATRNGTTLAGARVEGALPIGDGLSLELAGQVPCVLAPSSREPGAPIAVELAGDTVALPLGALAFGPWRIDDARDGGDGFVVVRTPPGAPPLYRDDYRLGERIELCHGDCLSDARGAKARIAVPETQ